MDATIPIPLSTYTQLIERAARAEQQVAELQAKIAEMVLNPPRRPRKPSEPKVRTPEEEEALRIKRSEAGKKSAETRRLKKLAEAEAHKQQQEAAIREQIRKELEAESSTLEADEF
jgi:hypothetical protein